MKIRQLKSVIIAAAAVAALASCATGFIEYSDGDYINSYYEITDSESSWNINGLFPDEVYVKTPTQSFNSYYQFQLFHGKIFYKGFEGGAPEDWTILKRTGLPRNFFEGGFTDTERIISISADSNQLVALSEEGIFYNMMFTSGLSYSDFTWYQKKGWPVKTELRIDETVAGMRCWALGRRGKEVLWYEDINGNQHHYGTIGIDTYCFLMDDGQEIRYSDPGLPSDFSHNILGPERGRFIADSLSASASTVFLINSAGEMYTRLVDFDTVGSDPMFFKYTYDPDYRDERPGSDYDTNFNYWVLPAESWKKQPAIRLTGAAALSPFITVLQNGQGNYARELRVAGLNPAGEPGFFYKSIDGERWMFRKAPFDLGGHLYETADNVNTEGARGRSPDRSMAGRLIGAGVDESEIVLRVDGFNLYEGSGKLTVCRGSEELAMDFHPVEMWYYLKRRSPGRDGSPKLFMVTLDLPEGELERKSPAFRRILEELFLPYDLETFAFYRRGHRRLSSSELRRQGFRSSRYALLRRSRAAESHPGYGEAPVPDRVGPACEAVLFG